MAVITATATIDDEGVVRGLRTINSEFREVGEAADRAGDAMEEAEEGMSDVAGAASSTSSRFEQFSESVQDATKVTTGYSNAQMNLVRNGQDMAASLDRQADRVEQINRQTQRLTTSQSKYNQIIFSSGDLVQDLQFGLRGAGNNIGFMAEQLAEVQGDAGSFKNVLSGIWSSLKGPAGIILAIQALIALGPTLMKWFSDNEERAEAFQDALKDSAESLLKFKDEIAGFEVEGLDQARQIRNELESQAEVEEGRLETLKEIRDTWNLTTEQRKDAAGISEEQFRSMKERFGLQNASLETVEKRVEEQQADVKALDQAVSRAKTMVQTREAALEVQQAIGKSSANQVDQQKELRRITRDIVRVQNEFISSQQDLSFDEDLGLNVTDLFDGLGDARNALENWNLSLRGVGDTLEWLRERQQDATGEELRRVNRLIQAYTNLQKELQNAGVETDKTFADSLESISQVQTKLDTGALNSIRKVNGALSFLDEKLKSATSREERERIRALIKVLKGLRDEMEKNTDEVTDFDSAIESLDKQRILAQALTENFVKLGEAIGQGENVMQSFGEAALGVLSSIGTAMGKQLIAQGSALVASALVPGQQGNAAAGAALIAAGTALVSASEALSGIIGGGGANRGTDTEDTIESGGEGGFVPGRRYGGPVEGGSLYETHGLGEREFFVPSVDGAIATAGQLQRATGRPSRQRVEVSVQNELQGSIDGPDLFELDTRLREVERFKEQFARQ